MKCPKCGSLKIWSQKNMNYKDGTKGKVYQCGDCKKYFTVRDQNKADSQLKTIDENLKPVVSNGEKLGISETEMRQRHDINYIIQNFLQSIPKGTYYKKDEVLKLTKLNINMRGVKDSLFADDTFYGAASDKTIYFGHPERITKLKEDWVLQ